MGVFDIDLLGLDVESLIDERFEPVANDIGGEKGSFFRR